MDSTEDPPGSPVLEALLQTASERRYLGERLATANGRVATDQLVDVVRHGPVLEALLAGPKDRRELEAALDVSRTTSHRFVHWLDAHDLATKREGRYRLTGQGEAVAEEVLRFEATVAASARLAPLLACLCDDHEEFVVEPFVDAEVTVASPADPHAPVQRFVSLVDASTTLKGFNTTHMVPLAFEAFQERLFADGHTELIYLPAVAERVFEAAPRRAEAALENGRLALRTRDDLPYGLALFDDRVGIAGYDDRTGVMRVFVDTDETIAREWAARVYQSVRADSKPLDATTLVASADGDDG